MLRLSAQLDVAEKLVPGKITGLKVDTSDPDSMKKQIAEATNGSGVEVVIECSGNPHAAAACPELCAPGGTIVWVGCPTPVLFDIGHMQVRAF